MANFADCFNSYSVLMNKDTLKTCNFGGFNFGLNSPHYNYMEEREFSFIINGILSIFDGNTELRGTKANLFDGQIDETEFNSISKEEYEKKVKEMKEFYKKNYGKDLDFHIPTYTELKYMLGANSSDLTSEWFKTSSGDNVITKEELFEPIVPNFRLGQTNQAKSGDCYQEGTDIALDYHGEFSRSLSRTADGRWAVTLYGAKPKKVTYYFTQAELKAAQEEMLKFKDGSTGKKYPYGDVDMVLYDMAVERYRKDTGHKLLPRHTAAQKGFDDYLSAGHFSETYTLITGKKTIHDRFVYCSTINEVAEGGEKAIIARKKAASENNKEKEQKVVSSLNNFMIQKQAAGCMFICADNDWGLFNKYNLYENHQYALKSYDAKNKTVTIANPHKGKYNTITMPLSVYVKFVSIIDHT